jgi:hypothetical protein
MAMAMVVTLALVLCLLVATAYADVYLHMPRGSNNRLDDQNRCATIHFIHSHCLAWDSLRHHNNNK